MSGSATDSVVEKSMIQLMGLPKNTKVVRYKWIFKITKRNIHGVEDVMVQLI